jgi:chromosome segregation ATPase
MRSVLNEAKERVKARRAARKEEEHMENKDDLPQVALEAALEANSVLKAELDQAREGVAGVTAKLAELEASLTQLTARAEDAELQRDALQAELAEAAEALTNSTAALQASQEQLAAIAAEQDKLAMKHRWEARFAELPESYRAAFAKRGDEEQARFTARWSAASDEAWAEFKSDLFVGFADAKLSYLKLSENEGVLPVGSDMDLGAKVSALIK